MKKEVHLTFKTDYETHYLLKTLAHMLGKTQPEFINEICQDYVKSLIADMQKMIDNKEIRHDGETVAADETGRTYQS